MPRKKSVSGRSRGVDAVNRIMIQAERINKQLRRLEKAGNYGSYKSKELMEFASRNRYVSIKKARGSKRHRLIVKKVRMSIANQRLISKKFDEVLKSKAFYNKGIEEIRRETRKKVTKTLSEEMGRDLTEEEVDTFYEIAKYKETEILNKINPSEFYQLVMEAKEKNYGVDEWINLLNNYVEINNEYIRKSAEKLYNKYVG